MACVVRIYGIGTNAADFYPCQRFLVFNALPETYAFIESLKGMVFYEGYAVNLYPSSG